ALAVTQQRADAELVITCDAQDFDRIVRGEEHPVIAGLQGRLTLSGKTGLFPLVQRLFPAPINKQASSAPPIPEHPTIPSPPVTSIAPQKPPEKTPTPSRMISILEGNTFV